jgi:class 3 adenylate cyclase
MSDLLAIFGPADADSELLAAVAAYRPDRVTVLVADGDAELVSDESSAGEALRERLAGLMSAIERRTGATVMGLAGDRAQLLGWRFDRELAAPVPVAA